MSKKPLLDVCRLCASNDAQEGDYFELRPSKKKPDNSVAVDNMMLQRIKYCFDIEIQYNDTMPTKVCRTCLELVSTFYAAKLMAETTQGLLKDNVRINNFLNHELPTTDTNNIDNFHDEKLTKFPTAESVISDNGSVNSSRKRSRPRWSEELGPTKLIGTTIDSSNILPNTDRRKQSKTDRALLSSDVFRRKNKQHLKNKNIVKKNKDCNKKTEKVRTHKIVADTSNKDALSCAESTLVSSNAIILNDLSDVLNKSTATKIVNHVKEKVKAGSSSLQASAELAPLQLHTEEKQSQPASQPLPSPTSSSLLGDHSYNISSGTERRSSSSGRIIKPVSRLADDFYS